MTQQYYYFWYRRNEIMAIVPLEHAADEHEALHAVLRMDDCVEFVVLGNFHADLWSEAEIYTNPG